MAQQLPVLLRFAACLLPLPGGAGDIPCRRRPRVACRPRPSLARRGPRSPPRSRAARAWTRSCQAHSPAHRPGYRHTVVRDTRMTPARRGDPRAHGRRLLALSDGATLGRRHARHLDAQIDAVQQRTAELAHVLPQTMRGASALAFAVAEEPARARVHGRHQHEPRREGHRRERSRDGHLAILERLAQTLEGRQPELGELVEEEHPEMRETDLARSRRAAAATSRRSRWCDEGPGKGAARPEAAAPATGRPRCRCASRQSPPARRAAA